jgi:NitT/TauT family transport system substrate-binding protein
MPSASSDLRRRKYKHFFVDEIPDRYEARVDVRRFSSGERIVFLPYSAEIYAETQA